jgi:hypothetical protein
MASFLLRLDIMSILRDCLLLISNAKNAKWIVGPLVFVSSAILLKWIKALPKRWQLASKVRQKQQERELALKRLRGELLVNGEVNYDNSPNDKLRSAFLWKISKTFQKNIFLKYFDFFFLNFFLNFFFGYLSSSAISSACSLS